MKIVKFNNGEAIPMLGLGTWLSSDGEVYKIVKDAIKNGYRHIDCAACYGNEKEIGQALSEVISEGIVKREELFITSKLWNNAHDKKDVLLALKETLSDLQIDYLDLYLIHWPVAFQKDIDFPSKASEYISLEELPVIETYTEMEIAVGLGLIKSIGVSNFSQKKLEDLISKSKIKPVLNQVELHPYLAQDSLLKFCKAQDIIMTGYCPLGSSGRPLEMKALNEPFLLENRLIVDLAHKYGKSPAQILLAWSINRGCVVIPKTVTPARAMENFSAQFIELESSDITAISKLDRHFRYVTGEFFTCQEGPYTLSNLWDEK